MQITIADRVAILNLLLSKADFFDDGKDLQTFVARLLSRAFFVRSVRGFWSLGIALYIRERHALAASLSSTGSASSNLYALGVAQSSIT